MALKVDGLYRASFLRPNETLVSIQEGDWVQHGQHFVSVAEIETDQRRFMVVQKAYYNSVPDGVRAYNERTMKLYKALRKGGASVPKTGQYDEGLILQAFVPGHDYHDAVRVLQPHLAEKARREVARQLELYPKIGLGTYPDHDNNFRITPLGNAFLVDIDFPSANV